MNRLRTLSFLCLLVVVCLFGCSKQNRLEILQYKNALLKQRAQKNKFFQLSPDSPIPSTERWQMHDLRYYPVDPAFQIEAKFQLLDEPEEFVLPTSSGQNRVYVKLGRINFRLQGHNCTLFGYQEKAWILQQEKHGLFVPFMDATTGKTTYGAGRYLDIEFSESAKVVLDFNLAYNPYCAYTKNYSCPLPPEENRLPLPIEAGEMIYTDH